MSEPTAAYVHVPFCAHHCGYCDFAVAAGQDPLRDRYLDALTTELATLGQPRPVQTLFIGGGTPTYLEPRQLDRLLAELRRWLPLVGCAEFSVESTPDSLDGERVAILARHGVTRVSIGGQSFHPHLLNVLERRHIPDEVSRALACARVSIPEISLDLIFGVPGQTLADWESDVQRALELAPDHLSTYGLTYEKGTRLWKQRQRGSIRPVDEETELAFYCHAMDALTAAGFEHYEISNFARPGRRCRHNEVYWANGPYYGFGVGAARYVNDCRELNTRDLQEYMRRTLAGQPATFQSETLQPEERARETMAIQLRRADGISRPQFLQQTGFALDAIAGEAIQRHVDLGLLADDGQTVRLTRQGKCVADSVIRNLL
jgi:oxygen-independent coproporphyrinogen-3 oxidase